MSIGQGVPTHKPLLCIALPTEKEMEFKSDNSNYKSQLWRHFLTWSLCTLTGADFSVLSSG